MTEEQRREANRRRVAEGVGDEYVAPGYTGLELIYLNRVAPRPSSDRGHSEGGWRAEKAKRLARMERDR